MNIAMMGTRGIPARYSGFETCVEELGARLVERGHQVTVYCRSHHVQLRDPYYRGMELVRLPTIQNKYLDTIVHTFLSTLHGLFRHYDFVLVFIVGNSPVVWIPRLTGAKVVLNVDGLDWQRQKWPALAKKYIRCAEYLATIVPNVVVTDSRVIQEYYEHRYGKASLCIAYGSDVVKVSPGKYLSKLGLGPRKYVLFVGRLVPENCAHHLVEAFSELDTDMKCVIIGDAPYAEEYIRRLKAAAGDSVLFTGYLFGEGYRELASHAYAFVETSEVGGTHPALVEAMAFGNCVVVNDTPQNLEVIGDAGFCYDGTKGGSSLRQVLQQLLSDPSIVREYGAKAEVRAAECYSWQAVTTQYEELFCALASQ